MQIIILYYCISFFIGYFVTYYSKDSFWALLILLILATIFGVLTATGFGISTFVLMFIGFFVRKMIRQIKDKIKTFFKR